MNVEIQEYTPEHKSALVLLMAEFQDALKELSDTISSGEKVGVSYTEYLIEEVAKKGGIIYLAFVDTVAVGFVCAYIVDDAKDEDVTWLYVSDLGVTKDYRGKGIGKSLLVKVEEWARENSLKYLRITALANNLGAQKLYRAVGYEDFGINLQKKLSK